MQLHFVKDTYFDTIKVSSSRRSAWRLKTSFYSTVYRLPPSL